MVEIGGLLTALVAELERSNQELTVLNAVVTTIPMPIAVGSLAVDPINRLVYVGEPESGEVYLINAVTNTILGSIAVDSGVWGMATDGVTSRVYTANKDAGTVVILGQPGIFVDDFESGNTSEWSATVP